LSFERVGLQPQIPEQKQTKKGAAFAWFSEFLLASSTWIRLLSTFRRALDLFCSNQ